ncbi:MAG: hypothetical protein U0L10_15755 [Lachnospiraceae bacterium]|nr:hypothetical protein [Lachnospiraceae bacterium]
MEADIGQAASVVLENKPKPPEVEIATANKSTTRETADISSAAKPLGTKFERLFAAPISNSFRAFSGTKPFSTEKLPARIRAVLHNHRQRVKNKNTASGNCQLQDLLIGYEKRRTFVGKNEIDLTLA